LFEGLNMRKAIMLVTIVSAVFLASCSKDGAREMRKATMAMENAKSFRVAASSKTSPEAISEFLCPDRVRSWHPGRGDVQVEMVQVGTKLFARQASESWAALPDLPATTLLPDGNACLLALQPFIFSPGTVAWSASGWPRNFEGFKYLGQDTVGGTPCDSWVARTNNFETPAPGRYHDDRLVRDMDFVVCINPTNHLILQIKRSDELWRYYDFNSPDITIPDPVVAK
jgi:hypothetical protein